MNAGEFIKCALDFGIKLPKQKIMEVFKKISSNSKEIDFD